VAVATTSNIPPSGVTATALVGTDKTKSDDITTALEAAVAAAGPAQAAKPSEDEPSAWEENVDSNRRAPSAPPLPRPRAPSRSTLTPSAAGSRPSTQHRERDRTAIGSSTTHSRKQSFSSEPSSVIVSGRNSRATKQSESRNSVRAEEEDSILGHINIEGEAAKLQPTGESNL